MTEKFDNKKAIELVHVALKHVNEMIMMYLDNLDDNNYDLELLSLISFLKADRDTLENAFDKITMGAIKKEVVSLNGEEMAKIMFYYDDETFEGFSDDLDGLDELLDLMVKRLYLRSERFIKCFKNEYPDYLTSGEVSLIENAAYAYKQYYRIKELMELKPSDNVS